MYTVPCLHTQWPSQHETPAQVLPQRKSLKVREVNNVWHCHLVSKTLPSLVLPVSRGGQSGFGRWSPGSDALASGLWQHCFCEGPALGTDGLNNGGLGPPWKGEIYLKPGEPRVEWKDPTCKRALFFLSCLFVAAERQLKKKKTQRVPDPFISLLILSKQQTFINNDNVTFYIDLRFILYPC